MYESDKYEVEWVDVDPVAALAWLAVVGEDDPPPPPDDPPPLLELVVTASATLPSTTDSSAAPDPEPGLDPLLDRLIAVRREASRLAAVEVEVLAQLARQDGYRIDGMAADLAAAAVGDTIAGMRRRIAVALTLTVHLPATMTALHTGGLGYRRAELIADTTDRLTAGLPDLDTRRDLAQRLETLVLDRAGEQTPPQLTARLRRTRIRFDPHDAEVRHRAAQAERCVRLLSAEDGMAELRALLPAEHAVLIHERLTAAARLLPHTDSRSRDQQRADLLIDAVLTGLPTDALPTAQHTVPSISVVVAASTLIGTDDEPGWLDRYGPITAAHARRLAHDPSGTWRRLVIDDTGDPMDYSTRRYRPPAALADLVTIRDPVCIAPGCGQPSRRCDLDHTTPFDADGPTNPPNLAPLCRHHHRLKTRGQLSYRRDPDGGYTTTYPDQGLVRSHQPVPRWAMPRPLTPATFEPDIEPDPTDGGSPTIVTGRTHPTTTGRPDNYEAAFRARQDHAYRDRIGRLLAEIKAARADDDSALERRLRTRLRETRRYRIDTLRRRQHPDTPPF